MRSLARTVFKRSRWGKKVEHRLPGRELKPGAGNGQGTHKAVALSRRGKVRKFLIHNLLLRTFVGTPKRGQECCHYDGDHSNNTLANLRWGTSADNAADRMRHGYNKKGTRHHGAKLDDDKVRDIRRRYAAGEGVTVIGASYGVAHTTIGRILHRGGWSHVE